MTAKKIRIGGASGYWGDAHLATPQLLAAGDLDFLVYDYLAEVTMSILARARMLDKNMGYAADFVTTAMGRNLHQIAEKKIKVISNAGGVNPKACGAALQKLIAKAGLDLKVAVVSGDDLRDRAAQFYDADIREMYSSIPFPNPNTIASINAYLGALPIAQALNAGADIIITGRCVDSAVTLGACLSAFDWPLDDFDKLAQASLAGHIIECGPQATGGNFTDWELVKDSLVNIGYPIVEIESNGNFTISKPENTGGLVSMGTVAEQILYEIGDPQSYALPDVVCDFSDVKLRAISKDCIQVSGAKGRPPSQFYKTSVTYIDGYRTAMLMSFTGFEAGRKAQTFADAALARAANMLGLLKLAPYSETSIELLGDFDKEIVLKLAVRHADKKAVGVLIREMTGLALATPAGLSALNAGRPKPSPCVRLFSMLVPKIEIGIDVQIEGENILVQDAVFESVTTPCGITDPVQPDTDERLVSVPLIELAWGRSGDKGDKANIGIIARRPEYLPWIWACLDADSVQAMFAHFNPSSTERFYVPGLAAINFLLHDVLGGGGMASLRNDPQGKTYAQILLSYPVSIPLRLKPKRAKL